MNRSGRKWVADASPVIVLAKVSQIHLLEELPDKLVIPSAVEQEITKGPPNDAALLWIQSQGAKYIQEAEPKGDLISAWGLGAGETQVLESGQAEPQEFGLIPKRGGLPLPGRAVNLPPSTRIITRLCGRKTL